MSTPTILPGQFFKAIPDGNEQIRGWSVIAVESGYLGEGTAEHGLARMWVIQNDTRTATPILKDYPLIEKWVRDAVWTHANGPIKPGVSLEDLSDDARKKVVQIEEQRYRLIKPIVELGNAALWPHVRREALKKRAHEVRKTVDYLWQLLCLYWQFGGRHGLRPRAVLAGQKSLAHRVKVACEKAKEDRTAKASPADFFPVYKTGPRVTEGVLEGKPIEYADVVQCRRGANKFLFKPSEDGKLRYRFFDAYIETLRVEYDYVKDGATTPTRTVPSYEQFLTAVRSDPKFARRSVRIVGLITAIRSHRPTKDTTQGQVLGPGHVLQIDDLDLKVTVVSAFNRSPIGRARCFVGSDQWSGLLAGAHETLAGSGYEGVRELLVNVARPKGPFLKEMGFKNIDAKYLPGHGVFAEVAADNGPLRARLGDILPKEFTSLANLPLFRGDLKPDIESSFHAFLRQVAEKLPGFTRVEKHIGQPDSDVIACLTMAELRQIIWAWMASYNSRVRDDFLPEAFLHLDFKDRPANTPYQLFPQGVIHVAGSLRTMPEEQIRRLLLRRATGTLTGRRGISFKGLQYFMDGGEDYRFKSEEVDIRYSENYVRQVYFWLKGRCETATISPAEAARFGHLSFPEIENELAHRRVSARVEKSNHLRVRVGTLSQTIAEKIASSQEELNKLHPDPRLRKQSAKTIGKASNRHRDRTRERRVAAANDATAFPPEGPADTPPTPLRKKSMRDLRRQATAPEPALP